MATNMGFLERRTGERHRKYILEVFEQCADGEDMSWLLERFRLYTSVYHTLNVVAVLRTNDGRVQTFTYSPFVEELIPLPDDVCRLKELFSSKINFMGHPLYVSLFPEEVRAIPTKYPMKMMGPDGNFADLLAKTLNATLILRRPADHIEYGNPTAAHNASGSLGQVLRGEVNISLNSRFMRLDLFRENDIVEPTNNIGRDDMCIIVPMPKTMSSLHNLIHSLDAFVWTLILVVIFPYTLLVKLTASNPFYTLDRPFRRFHLLDALRSYFSQTLTRLPTSSILRCIVILWIVYCFIITNIFQSGLTSTFTVNILEKEINTIDELIKSDYSVVAAIDYGKLVSRYFESSPLSGRSKLLQKMRLIEWSEYNRLIANNNTVFAYVNKHHLTTFYANTKMNEGRSIYRAVRECPVPFLACYIVPFGSPLLGHLNRIIGQLEQSGIFRYWDRRVNADSLRPPIARQSGYAKPLKLNQIFAFYFLLGGLCIALVIFLVEIIRSPRKCKRKRKIRDKGHRKGNYLKFFCKTLIRLCQRFVFGQKHR